MKQHKTILDLIEELGQEPKIESYTSPAWIRRLFEPIRKWWEKKGCDWGGR